MYKSEFIASLDRNNRLGLCVPKVAFSSARLLTQETIERIAPVVYDAVGELGPEDVVAKCISLHHTLLEPLERLFCTKLFYTIGYIVQR